eukprot:s1163_g3.t1
MHVVNLCAIHICKQRRRTQWEIGDGMRYFLSISPSCSRGWLRSTQGAALGDIDLHFEWQANPTMATAEEAFRVALQTATSAAQAATAALAEIKRSQAAGLASKPKELDLSGRPEEDRRLWSDWKFSAIQFLMTKDVACQENIERHLVSANAVSMAQLPEDEKSRSRQLFSFLAGTVKARLLALVRAHDSNGFEAIRRIQLDIEPRQVEQRHSGCLRQS